jgi:hypothetical protein
MVVVDPVEGRQANPLTDCNAVSDSITTSQQKDVRPVLLQPLHTDA